MLNSTMATDSAMKFDSIKEIKEIMDGFDPTSIMPELNSVLSWVRIICRVAVLVGPVILLALGLIYLFLTPKEANHYLGYRCYFGMGSDKAWLFTQRIAGYVFCGLGGALTLIMGILSMTFGRMEMMDMVWRSLWCLVWEAALTVIATAGINGLLMYWFNRKGDLRKSLPQKTKKI